MSTLQVVILLFADTLGSGFLGWLIGRTASNAALLAAEARDDADEGAVDETARADRKARAKDRLRRVRPQHVVMAVLLFVGAVTALQGFSVATQQTSTVTCVVDYSNQLGDALDQRAAASKRLQDKQDAIWTAVSTAFAHPGTDPQGTKIGDAVDDYNTERDRLRTAQAAHPLPETPRGACAGLLR